MKHFKIISLALVICMLASLVTCFAVSGEGDGVSLTHSYTYTTDSANIITWALGKDLGEVSLSSAAAAAKTHAWWTLARCEWSPAENAFVVTDISVGDNSASDFRQYEIPQFGFVLAAHHSGSGAATELTNFINTLAKGDKVYVSGVDLANVTADMALTDAKVSKTALEGAYTIDTTKLLTSVAYASGDVTIFFPYEKDGVKYNTLAKISGDLIKEEKDYNYYAFIAVDADNKITAINNTLGRPDGVKGDLEIPDGGYAIGVNGGNFSAYVGDEVCLFGVDREACTGHTGNIENAYFAIQHTHGCDVTDVVAPTCTETGYTKNTCRCGKEMPNSDPTEKADHTMVDTTNNYIIEHKCSVCGHTEYSALYGDLADIKVSHHNNYNWGTFEAMIISGDGKTVKDGCGYELEWWIVYKVEKVEGEYVATEVYNDDKAGIGALTVPEGGFLLCIYSSNDAYKYDVDLLGYHFYDVEGIIEGGNLAIDTTKYATKHIYAASAVAPKEPLNPDDYTVHPSVNTSITTNAKTIVTDPSTAANYNPNWSGRVLLAPTETPGIYTVVETQKPNGSAPTFTETIGEGYIILLLHGESGEPDGEMRDRWLALEPGTEIVVSGYNFEADLINEDAYATIYTDQVPVIPQPEEQPSEDPSQDPSRDPELPPTGDSGIVAIAILAVVALFGSAIVIKVRH